MRKLDDLVELKVLVPVTDPTQWVSSMLTIVKLPTINEIASRLAGAKKFRLWDATCGFHQILLDDASSFLTTFKSPFRLSTHLALPKFPNDDCTS